MADDEEYTEENHDLYSEEGREEAIEDDEMEPWEEGFMEGAESEGQNAKCRKCGKLLTLEDTVEIEVNGHLYWFCSEEHAEEYGAEHRKKK